ncbi:Glycoside hydrolase, family 3, N-terminal [Sesbania bispinosa]|nr:Glycoside hydrolase, family 3, N-terminal [Sesbania bispinosa]
MEMLRFLVLLLCYFASAEAGYMHYRNPKLPIEWRIKDLLGRMTLSEKIGQMVQIERSQVTPEVLKKYSIGSVLSVGGSVPSPKATPQKWINMVNEFQNASLSTRLRIPIMYGIDAVHGHNYAYKATIFPHNIGLGATRDHNLVRRIGAATALEVRATGINYVFAPCVAVCRDPRWGRCYESYSEDPNLVKEMTDIISGLQGEIPTHLPKGVPYVSGKKKVAACAKHFGVMVVQVKGFVISDMSGIEYITDPPHVMQPFNHTEFINVLTYLVKNKFIPMSRIDDAVGRILRVKFKMGLFEHPMADYSLVKQLGSQKHRELAREAVRKSLDTVWCWTMTWQGLSGNNITKGTTIFQAVKNAVDPSTKVIFKKDPSLGFVKQNDFDYAIVVVGEKPYAETSGDSKNLTLSEPGGKIIKNVCVNTNCVVIVMSGRPVVIEPYLRFTSALVAAWLPGTEGEGVVLMFFLVTMVLLGNYHTLGSRLLINSP